MRKLDFEAKNTTSQDPSTERWTGRQLFEALHDTRLATAAGMVRIVVYSVFEGTDRRWIQVGIEPAMGRSDAPETSGQMFTLALKPSEGFEEAMKMLLGRLGSPTSHFPNVA
jgi:hypothetical protein